jgi:hypothetical protein
LGRNIHDTRHQLAELSQIIGRRRLGRGGNALRARGRPCAAGDDVALSIDVERRWLAYKAFLDLCERIKANTNGRLIIEPFAAGAVAGVFETLDAVGVGVLQAHSSWPGYFSGKDAGRHQ